MTGDEGGTGAGMNVSAMCLVCGTNQANLTQHLSRHSKEEIIRAVTHGRPLPELVTRRAGPGRPRKPTFPPAPLATVAPLSLRPTTSQTPLLLTGNPPQQPALAAPLAPIPQATPAPQPTSSQPVRLGSIGPLIQPPRNGLPLATAPVQPGTPAGNYLLIGNNVFPAGGVISNNLQLGNNGVSYIIPSSGGLVLAAAAPPSSQTLLVQSPTTAPQTLPVKQQPPTTSLGTTGGVYNAINCRPPRPLQSEPPVCVFEGASSQVQSDTHTPTSDTLHRQKASQMQSASIAEGSYYRPRNDVESESHRATINIGKNISISLPRELVGQKDRLKDIINQELVRALLMNEAKVNEAKKGVDHPESQPSTSTGKRKTSYFPAKFEEEDVAQVDEKEMNIGQEFCEEEDGHAELDEEQHYCGSTQDVDPLATLVGPPHAKCREESDLRDTVNTHIDPNVPSPAHNITIENSLENNFINPATVCPYNIPVDEPMEVIFTDRPHCSQALSGPSGVSHNSTVGIGNQNEKAFYDRNGSKLQFLVAGGAEVIEDSRLKKVLGKKENLPGPEIVADVNIARIPSEQSHSGQTPNINQNRQVKRDHGEETESLCEEQPMSFLTTDRTLNTLLGDTSLQEMVYVEEQVLGAVEEVFAGDNSSLPSTSSSVMNESTEQKLLPQRLTHSYVNLPAESEATSSSFKHDCQDKKQDIKCKFEPSGCSSQPGCSTNRPATYQANQLPPNSQALQSSSSVREKEEVMTQEQEEELVDDPSLVEGFGSESIFHDDQIFEREMNSQQSEEVMSLKASETLADSDSERATPHEELPDLMFYDRSCMFAGEAGPANLSPRTYPAMDSSAFHALTPAMISPLESTVQMERADSGTLPSLGEGGSGDGVVELTSSETTMHITSEECCTVMPPEGLNIGQLFPTSYGETTAVPATSVSHVSNNKVAFADFMEDSKLTSKIMVLEKSCNTLNRQLSPVPSTSGLQGSSAPQKSSKEDEDYEFEYESDCYGDSDSDCGVTNRGPLDLDHWKCLVCNKMFKSLKEKLLHAGQHSPCAEAMEKSGAIRSATQAKSFQSVIKKDTEEEAAALLLLKCKEEMNALQEETRSMLESFASNGEYKCPECTLPFPSAEMLFEHRKAVFKSRVTCQVCHMVFKKRHAKIKHMKAHTVDDLKCLICNRTYPNRYSWSQHQLFHMGLVLFECKECGRRFQRKSELEVHMRTHTGERPYSCASCKSAFTTRQALKRHLVTHMDGQEVDCEVCHKTYKNIVCLNKHRLKAHSKNKGKAKVRRDYMCSTCNEVFPSSKKLAWHREIHERWPKKCQHCGECFVHQSSLTKHIRHKHDPHHQTPDGKTENNTTCPVCRKVFKKSSLVLHLRTHTGVKPFQCNICNRSFAVKCNLEAHKWVHMGVRDRPHKCKLCERSFHRQKDLDAHIRSHKNIRPFTCNECGKSFIHKNNLQLHVREHSGEKQHKCMYCEKAFFRKYNLDNHVRIHTGEMPYECTICHKDFTQKSNYNVHMKAFHVERHAVHEEL